MFNTCREFIRTFPALSYDPLRPEDINTDMEDHIYDATRYFFMNGTVKAKKTDYKPKPFNPLDDTPRFRNGFL